MSLHMTYVAPQFQTDYMAEVTGGEVGERVRREGDPIGNRHAFSSAPSTARGSVPSTSGGADSEQAEKVNTHLKHSLPTCPNTKGLGCDVRQRGSGCDVWSECE